MAEQGNDNFMGGRTVLAIVLTAGLLFGWQTYMSQKYGNRKAPASEAQTASPLTTANTPSGAAATKEVNSPETPQSPKGSQSSDAKTDSQITQNVQKAETRFPFESENWKFDVSSIGMRLHNVVLKSFKNRALSPVILGQDNLELFETAAGENDAPIYFEISLKKPNEIVGVAQVGAAKITKTMVVDSAHYTLNTTVEVVGGAEDVKSLSVLLPEKIADTPGATIFKPSLDRQTLYVSHGDTTSRDVVNPKGSEDKKYNLVDVVSIGSLYFASAIVDQSNVRPDLKTHFDLRDSRLGTSLKYPRLDQKESFKINYAAFAGPKSLDLLKEVDPKLSGIVDFGMFGLLARPMLWLMKIFYSFVGNYGMAIILLTLMVRLLVLPFNVMSFKSMKVMAKLNPQMKELREKYAKDPARMNMEIAALLKENKANPLGGCLPMLIQMPVFFALYRVLGNSIELYQAPFALWIQDLSLKDPFYVLPVLIGLSMFMQQKLTPNTMDPQQAKMMAFMPLLFSGMMIFLPSGLALYIFVSTLFGVTQQKILLGDRTAEKKAIQIKA
jgi:YidC/Oxa1 family membrane protein insertase